MSGAHCRSCGASIVWATTIIGKAHPFDAQPSDDGTFYLVCEDDGKDFAVHMHAQDARAEAAARAEAPRYRSHFASCPDAAKHRRRK
jgi:hypothetical protein